MARFSVVVFVCACLVGCKSAQPDAKAALTQRLDPLLHRLDRTGAVFAARVIELPGGRELYAYRPDEPMMPASNGKLANVASGLDHFGVDRTFKTYLAMDGDDLWLIGTGDPGPGDDKIAAAHNEQTTSMIDRWSEQLRAKGVSEIKGNFYFYDGIFDAEWTNKTWSRGFLTDWYAAPVTGLTFNDNCIDVTVYPTEDGKAARYEVVPPTTDTVQIKNEAFTGRRGVPATADIERDRENNIFTITGTVTAKKKLQSKPVTDPSAFFADAVRTNLASHGITIRGKVQRSPKPLGEGVVPPEDKIVAVHETSMHDILWRINQNSQNLFAEAMCKLQGRDWNLSHGEDTPGSWTSGGDAVHEFLRRNKIDDSKYVLVDGSGLSRQNHVTTRLITDLMMVMSKHTYANEWRRSLAAPGGNGTLRSRMTDIAPYVRAKTGSIGGVRSLSGYVTTRKGKQLAFSILYNNYPARRDADYEPVLVTMDDACRVMVEYPNVARAQLRSTTQPSTLPTSRPTTEP